MSVKSPEETENEIAHNVHMLSVYRAAVELDCEESEILESLKFNNSDDTHVQMYLGCRENLLVNLSEIIDHEYSTHCNRA